MLKWKLALPSLRYCINQENLYPVSSASGRSEIEADEEVQVSWGCIHEWRDARWRYVQEGKTCCISLHLCSQSHLWTWVLGNDRKNAIASASSKMRFLRRIKGVTLFDKVCNSENHNSLNVESLLLRIERSQLRWFGHVSRMPQERLPNRLCLPFLKVIGLLED